MDLKQLQAMGAFVPKTLFKREVEFDRPVLRPEAEWASPDEPEYTGELVKESVTAWIRKRSSADFMEIRQAPTRDQMSVALLRCVCHEDGAEVFESIDQVRQLEEWFFVPLMWHVSEVNKFGAKNSQPRTSGGANSHSASAAGRLRSGKRRSVKKSSKSGSSTPPSAAR